ncbi:DUF4184 family protein [Cardiobacteriaceae bacterium TAE3-ERU3]|nr:DUF4184 family protein [Cardiobacteriaceae bacterium TAE3-ERU3]
MPFTFAHPAAVLPLYRCRSLSFSGLVVGAMAPDLEYFIKLRLQGELGHSFWGLWYFDIPLGLLVLWLFQRVIRDSMLRHLPSCLQQRFAYCYRQPWRHTSWLMLVFSIWLGAVTHVIWDSFTHVGRTSVWLPVLAQPSLFGASWPWSRVLQHISTFSGLAIIACFVYRLPRSGHIPTLPWYRTLSYWGVVLAIAVILLLLRFQAIGHLPALGNVVVVTISALAVALFIVSLIDCALWKVDN